MKAFEFVSEAAKRDFPDLPREIVSQFGVSLNAIQNGQEPLLPIKHLTGSVGPGAIELIENGSPAYRAVYCAKFEDTVFILHAFTKTTNGVDRKAMRTAQQRYKEMIALIAERKKQKNS
ncbi:type II toxin-antitoxin system RelE/ParE family toxin [Hoeflea ulvae]|uniref:Type II toxin-antitoxin system RelE/ParE family toxin n=1 Tax=Hoeflea ulvae TaxID=2983764 RepID=A0ABT3YBN5_9HYPH|nr:type II toxin-antitoxin system RelE/ParE family toxin [Hoeflea ulvae]MCY0093122.1 type II toxin-antitoxin system RelE/ParE family toxin [Hoeflea ulvae]